MENADNTFKKNLEQIANNLEKEEKASNMLNAEIEEGGDNEKAEVTKQDTAKDWILKNTTITEEMISQWKELYGDKVYFVSFDDTEYYAFRYLSRIEYKEIVKQIMKAKNLSPVEQNELMDELIVQKCLIYPAFDVDLKTKSPAGTIESLAKQIRVYSNFLSDDFALSLVVKL
jgi:hypothetical protein